MTRNITAQSAATKVKTLWKRYKPEVRFMLDLGFVGFRSNIMCVSYEMQVLEYLRVEWHLFKWRGYFDLLSPDNRRRGAR